MTDTSSLVPALSYACLGVKALGLCAYNPGAPFSVYFSLGEAIGALGFTLAVQQLLKPIYLFRLGARYLSLRWLYACVFLGALAVLVAAVVPSFPVLHAGPWGYPIVWEIAAVFFFAFAYGAIILAIVQPIRVRPETIVQFTVMSAQMLSSANEQDHIDYEDDLGRSLPVLINTATFTDGLRETSAFFNFRFRKEIERAEYASSFLRIVADPAFCETLVKRLPWRVAEMLNEIAAKKIHARGAEQFVRELARQAILRDDGMMAREVGYHGFGTAPILSESLFSKYFILDTYNPLSFISISSDTITQPMVKRFNSAAERCLTALIDAGSIYDAKVSFCIQNFYRTIFMRAWEYQATESRDYHMPLEMEHGVELVIKFAERLQTKVHPSDYEALYVVDPKQYRHDVLETLVAVVYEALAAISNRFTGVQDAFWTTAIRTFLMTFPRHGHQPDGMTPFQQRLTLLLIDKLRDNMNGFYPAICRVLLACVGPYHDEAAQPNRTAFNILKDAMYYELQQFPQLAAKKPDKIGDYLPDNVTYSAATTELTQTYRGGGKILTNLSTLNLAPVSLLKADVCFG